MTSSGIILVADARHTEECGEAVGPDLAVPVGGCCLLQKQGVNPLILFRQGRLIVTTNMVIKPLSHLHLSQSMVERVERHINFYCRFSRALKQANGRIS
jgi:hypothetical protein